MAQIGFFLDELNLSEADLEQILSILNPTDDELAILFYELNLTETQWNNVLPSVGRAPQSLANFANDGGTISDGSISSWESAVADHLGCFEPTPTPSPHLRACAAYAGLPVRS